MTPIPDTPLHGLKIDPISTRVDETDDKIYQIRDRALGIVLGATSIFVFTLSYFVVRQMNEHS